MKRAFSLVELSIVLVILGLLVGGILGGKSLIRASELRAVIREQQKYTTAVHAFRDKYFALPGDMANATSFWGIENATPYNCYTTASTTAKTCNGDGDSQIEISVVVFPGIINSYEWARFWQHLANAQLIEGTYNGVTATVASRLPGALWSVTYYGDVTGNAAYFDGSYMNRLSLSMVLKPEEAWNIDSKLDDGKPGTGKIVTGTDCTNAVSSTDYAATYLLSSSSTLCSLYFRAQF